MIFRSNILLLFPLIILLISCSGPELLTVHHQDQPIEVDGNLSNWNKTDALLKSTSEIDYYATVHGNNLYLFVDVKGLMKYSAITKSGLIVYLSDSEENRNQSGFAFPPGSFNLLRQYPNGFEEFTTDMEWSRQPENVELLEELSEDLFSSIMIVERPMGENDAEYGFIEKSQLEIDGFEIAGNADQRFISMEMKIPLGETSLFNLTKDRIWLGFSIEPPDFNFRDTSSTTPGQRDSYGRRSQRQTNIRYAMSRNLGESDDWFLIDISNQ
ncbi:MAG: hypothetical protein R3220_01145 [Balneolaceae bacterium]|nr:hypothetical protein [Balneolaceae bacterium]